MDGYDSGVYIYSGSKWIKSLGLNDPDNNIFSFWSTVASNHDGTKLFACCYNSNNNNGVYTYSGSEWTKSTTNNQGFLSVASDSTGDNLVAGGFNGNIYRNTPPPNPCFLKKTGILTPSGFLAVENLKIGDAVFTKGQINKNGIVRFEDIIEDCQIARIKWLGHFTSSCPPVCFLKGSLGKNVPIKNLYVSPDHQFLIKNRMVQARHLLNDSTIFRVDTHKNEYYHVELDTHAVIIAEGALTESYLDVENRWCFTNTAERNTNTKKKNFDFFTFKR